MTFEDWYKKNEILFHQSHYDERQIAHAAFDAGKQSNETRQHEPIVNGTRYTEREFLARAVRNAIPRGMQDGVPIDECPKWVAVRDAFGCGSGYAHALCHEFNLAPGKIVKRSGH